MFEHLDLNHLLATYGYLAVFVGCLLEGETILILGGVAAHQQVLKLLPVIAYASLAGMLGDQLLFWAGRYFGDRLLPRLHKKQAAIDKITTLIHRYPTVSIFSVRFLYGMRLVGALVWATLFASAGYWAGEFLQRVLGDLKPYRLPIALGVVGVVVAVGLIRHYRSRRKQP